MADLTGTGKKTGTLGLRPGEAWQSTSHRPPPSVAVTLTDTWLGPQTVRQPPAGDPSLSCSHLHVPCWFSLGCSMLHNQFLGAASCRLHQSLMIPLCVFALSHLYVSLSEQVASKHLTRQVPRERLQARAWCGSCMCTPAPQHIFQLDYVGWGSGGSGDAGGALSPPLTRPRTQPSEAQPHRQPTQHAGPNLVQISLLKN